MIRSVSFCCSSGDPGDQRLGLVPSLPELFAVETEPAAALLENAHIRRDVENRTGLRNAFIVHDIELGLAERGRHFILVTLTRARLPMILPAGSLITVVLRISMRIEA